MSATRTFNVARRSQTYLLLVGVVVGMFVAGLAVPFVFGESLSKSSSNTAAPVDATNLGAGAPPAGQAEAQATTTTAAAAGAPTGAASNATGGAAATPGALTRATTATTAKAAAAGSGGGGTTGATVAAAGSPAGATDRGVTANTIRVGAVVLDVATVGRMGVGVAVDPDQQMA